MHHRVKFILAAVAAVFVNLPARAELRIVGTDLLGIEFSKALYQFAGRSRLTVALAFDGSWPGVDELKSGRADLVLAVLPDSEAAAMEGFSSVVVAYHCVVVLAPSACPLECVTLDQLAHVFGSAGPVGALRWNELGLADEWAASALALAAPDVGAGLALEHFRHAVLRQGGLRSNVGRYRSSAELVSLFAGQRRVLAIGGFGRPASLGKTIALALRPNSAAYLPTPENVHAGDYPLRLPLRLVFRRESTERLRPVWRHLLGDEAAAHFEHAGFVPLPASARAQQVLALEKR